ncbi:MAG: RsmE family RNA methyltransferase, partial [Rhodocyclaceae bacterium]|nr:RsmE family RNA methyltransferase [Rhodocyclaceae bacterium]
MIPRFHCPFPLAPGAQVDLPEAAAHHAIRVLRLKEGAALILFDGRGGEWQATIVGAGGTASRVRVALQTFTASNRESPLHITLAQGLPSGDKMDWVVEKGVELGVAAIQPVAARRSVI